MLCRLIPSSEVAPSMPNYVGATIITPPNYVGATIAPPFTTPSQLHEQWNRDILSGNLRCFAGLVDCLSRAREDWETAQESCKQDRDQDSLHSNSPGVLWFRVKTRSAAPTELTL